MKKYNSVLLICPNRLSLSVSFNKMLQVISTEVISIDSTTYIKSFNSIIQRHIFRFPYKLREEWARYFQGQINKKILEVYKQNDPELVFVYNSEYLLPDTCKIISESSKMIFFLGDSPFYTPINSYFLNVLQYASAILAPDTFWLKQLQMLGYSNTHFFVPNIDYSGYKKIPFQQLELLQNDPIDILYVGTSYLSTWGYKKARLMAEFTEFKFHLYGGKHWDKWFRFFPELEKVYFRTNYIPIQELNLLFNRAKLIPVDGNPGLINGMHIRALEVLSSGTLPLIEYRSDVDEIIFKEMRNDIPTIKTYKSAKNLANYYLNNDRERIETVKAMNKIIEEKYSTCKNASYLLEILDTVD